uniref:Secreted protein n=1 Tax=Trypanosoma vivax (strain Y486) TaxID=1055687 RepID=G0UCB6_TRYVY|nr:hypothetical protein, unlikely [Trypanosoma vivax Y486]
MFFFVCFFLLFFLLCCLCASVVKIVLLKENNNNNKYNKFCVIIAFLPAVPRHVRLGATRPAGKVTCGKQSRQCGKLPTIKRLSPPPTTTSSFSCAFAPV